ncbi:hypothetical protein [Caudoviricetes sp.]|nr:hypothetical protein [Caudoviricetes sp.]
MISPTKEFFVRLKAIIELMTGRAVYIPEKNLTPREAGYDGGALPLSATPILEYDTFRSRWLSHVRFFSQVLSVVQVEVERPLQVIEELPAPGSGKLVCTSLRILLNSVMAAVGASKRRTPLRGLPSFDSWLASDVLFDDPHLPIKPLMAEVLASWFLGHQAKRAGYRIQFLDNPTRIALNYGIDFNSLSIAVRTVGAQSCMYKKTTPVGNRILRLHPDEHALRVEHTEYTRALVACYEQAGMTNVRGSVWIPYTVGMTAHQELFERVTTAPNAPWNWLAMQLWPSEDYHETGSLLRAWFVGFKAWRTLRSLERASVPPAMIKRPSYGDGLNPNQRVTPTQGCVVFKDIPPFENSIVGCYCSRCASLDEVQALLPYIPDDAVKGGPQFLEQHLGTIIDMPNVYGSDFCETIGIMKESTAPMRQLLHYKNQILTNFQELFV